MATDVKKPGSDIVWVNYDLTKQDKARMAELFTNEDDVYAATEALIRSDHKITLGWDERAKAFAAYAFPNATNSLNRGMALSARSRTAFGALMGLVYRHNVVFEGNWRADNNGPRLDDDE